MKAKDAVFQKVLPSLLHGRWCPIHSDSAEPVSIPGMLLYGQDVQPQFTSIALSMWLSQVFAQAGLLGDHPDQMFEGLRRICTIFSDGTLL